MLEVKNVTKRFKDKLAVENVSFTLNKGEIVGLLGENGAGKTTTLRMISTMLKPTEGSVLVNGFDVAKESDRVRSQIGILFGGEVGIYDRLTARENIKYFGSLYGIDGHVLDQRIDKMGKDLDMMEYMDRRVGKFSRGMKQKVAIARSIVHEPPIMLFDEPSTGLDVTAARIVQDFILKCKEEGKTILFSSHSIKEVEKLCDRVIIINKGKIVEEGTLGELKEKYDNNDLEEVFVKIIGGGINA